MVSGGLRALNRATGGAVRGGANNVGALAKEICGAGHRLEELWQGSRPGYGACGTTCHAPPVKIGG